MMFFNKYNCIFTRPVFNNARAALFFLLPVFLLSYPSFSYSPGKKEIKKDAALVLESANSNENTYSNGEFVSVLQGNVVFSYDKTRIKADEATWWRSQGIIQFRKNVVVTDKAQKLTCDQMNFTKASNMLTAVGHFKFVDTVEHAQLTGNEGEYYMESKKFLLRGDPRMIRFDKASAETLTITGTTMSYSDSLKRASVADNVRITKGKLVSKCALAHYFTQTNIAFLRTKPEVTFDKSFVNGDSINLYFGKESLKKASVYGQAHAVYTDTSANKNDTTFTHIRGDSLILSVSDSGVVDSLWTFGKAHSEYYAASDPKKVNEAHGKMMVMSFGPRGAVKNVKIAGNATSKYYVEEQNSNGTNEASGDSITVTFSNGKASRLVLSGTARGMYVPRRL